MNSEIDENKFIEPAVRGLYKEENKGTMLVNDLWPK